MSVEQVKQTEYKFYCFSRGIEIAVVFAELNIKKIFIYKFIPCKGTNGKDPILFEIGVLTDHVKFVEKGNPKKSVKNHANMYEA